jgi:hypothetical protein
VTPDLNSWFEQPSPELPAPRQRKNGRPPLTDPDKARGRALALGFSREEAEEAAQTELEKRRHQERAAEEEGRLAAQREQQAKSSWGVL